MTKVQKRIMNLAERLGGVTHFDLNARNIPFSALQALVNKGKIIRNINSEVYYINPVSE